MRSMMPMSLSGGAGRSSLFVETQSLLLCTSTHNHVCSNAGQQQILCTWFGRWSIENRKSGIYRAAPHVPPTCQEFKMLV